MVNQGSADRKVPNRSGEGREMSNQISSGRKCRIAGKGWENEDEGLFADRRKDGDCNRFRAGDWPGGGGCAGLIRR